MVTEYCKILCLEVKLEPKNTYLASSPFGQPNPQNSQVNKTLHTPESTCHLCQKSRKFCHEVTMSMHIKNQVCFDYEKVECDHYIYMYRSRVMHPLLTSIAMPPIDKPDSIPNATLAETSDAVERPTQCRYVQISSQVHAISTVSDQVQSSHLPMLCLFTFQYKILPWQANLSPPP